MDRNRRGKTEKVNIQGQRDRQRKNISNWEEIESRFTKRDRNKRGFARNECVRTEHVHQRERKNFPRGSARNPSALNWSTRVSPSHDDARTVERAKLID